MIICILQDTVLTLLKEAMLKKAATSKGFLIDGYPRELEQGKKFENDVAPVKCVLYFEVADETMKKRLMKRAETSGRVDDNEETIVKRLKTFHNHTQPVIDYYTTQNKVCKVIKLHINPLDAKRQFIGAAAASLGRSTPIIWRSA